ncbi:unnamed protein product [Linum trigynum]|uniref:CCHC-type domain-containing protein n=1 Tax=Linum trigynum TaxID=586398 RepID=A0AAV2CG11_9ROSI
MDLDRSDVVGEKLNDSNYSLWALQFSTYAEGKSLLDILLGETACPTQPTATSESIATWRSNNARLKGWILRSVDPVVALTLRSFATAAEMWAHLRDSYAQVHPSRQFEVEFQLSLLAQGDKSIAAYYRAATNLWIEADLMTASSLTQPLSAEVKAVQKRQRMMQFLSKLRPEFEPIRATLLSRNIATLEATLPELQREERRLTTQAQVDSHLHDANAAFAASPARRGSSHPPPGVGTRPSSGSSTPASRPQFVSPTGDVRCHYCQEPGHIQPHCRVRNLCTYCKRTGHIILDCPRLKNRPPRPSGSTGHAYVAAPGGPVTRPPPQATPAPPAVIPGVSSETLDAALAQALQRILPTALNVAFPTAPNQGNNKWLLDSAAFNHMTYLRQLFSHIRPVDKLSLQVANGHHLPVSGVGTFQGSQLTLDNTLYVPKLVPNLVSVGQLAERGYRITFDGRGCLVQDPITGMTLGRGSNHGRLYQLDQFTPTVASPPLAAATTESREQAGLLSPLSNSVFSVHGSANNVWDLWHSRLGHLHTLRLREMFKNNLLPDHLDVSSIPSSRCFSCAAAKMVHLPFSSSTTSITDAFHLVHSDL